MLDILDKWAFTRCRILGPDVSLTGLRNTIFLRKKIDKHFADGPRTNLPIPIDKPGGKLKISNLTLIKGQNGVYNHSFVYNPYRAATSSAASVEETMGWTVGYSTKTGLTSTVKTFSGAGLPAPWGTNSTTTGTVTTERDAAAITTTDQAGKLRRSITNALGQLVRADEPNDSNQLGTREQPQSAHQLCLRHSRQPDDRHADRRQQYADSRRSLTAASRGFSTAFQSGIRHDLATSTTTTAILLKRPTPEVL